MSSSSSLQPIHECEQVREIERLQKDTEILKEKVGETTTNLAVFSAVVQQIKSSVDNLQRSIETNREFMEKLLARTDDSRNQAQNTMIQAVDTIVNRHSAELTKVMDAQIVKLSDNYAKTTEKILEASADAIAKAVKTTLNDPSVQQIRTDGVSRKDAVEAAKLQETVKTLKVLVYGFVSMILLAAAGVWISLAVRSPLQDNHPVAAPAPAAGAAVTRP